MQTRLLLSIVAMTLVNAPACGHFLFIRITPPAEAGRAVEIYFSDRLEAGDTRFIDKIAGTTLTLQIAPGKFEALPVQKTPDRLRAIVPQSGPVSVVGQCTYGVIARKGQTPFLLRHFPRAVAGRTDALNAFKPSDTPLEIVPRFANGGVFLQVLRQGKPAPDAELTVVSASGTSEKIVREKGGGWLKPTASGYIAVYTSISSKAADVHQGKKYEEIRDFATLAFAWPIDAQGADPRAVALFEEALDARASWHDFPGFTATLSANVDGRPSTGSITIDAAGKVDVTADDEVALEWIQEQLESLALHRLARPRSKERPVLRFADRQVEHPLGRLLIFEGGRFASSYRVRDKQIMVVNRNLGKTNMTITVLDNERTKEGTYLPRTYTVHYWDAAKGTLQKSENFQQSWERVGTFDLPRSNLQTVSSDAGLSVRSFTLTGHKLLGKK